MHGHICDMLNVYKVICSFKSVDLKLNELASGKVNCVILSDIILRNAITLIHACIEYWYQQKQ